MQCALKSGAKSLWTEHGKIKALWRLDPKSILTKPAFYCPWKLYKLREEDRSGSKFLFLSVLWLLALNWRKKWNTFPWLQHLWCHPCCIFYSLPFRFLSKLILICSPFRAYSGPVGFPTAHFTTTVCITVVPRSDASHTLCNIFVKAWCSLALMSELNNSIPKGYFLMLFMKMEDSPWSFGFKISWFCFLFHFRVDISSLPYAGVWSVGYAGVDCVRTCVLVLLQNYPLTVPHPLTSFRSWLFGRSHPCTHLGIKHWNRSWGNGQFSLKKLSLKDLVFVLEFVIFVL